MAPRPTSPRQWLAWLSAQAALFVLGRCFVKQPTFELDAARSAAFEQLFQSAVERGPRAPIAYDLPYPKVEFLHYLVTHHSVLLHGAHPADSDVLRPRPYADSSGRRVNAVVAAGDAIWPLFLCLIDRRYYRGSLRHACFVVAPPGGQERRFYFFSVNAALPRDNLWHANTLDILLKSPFRPVGQGVLRFDEWISERPVFALARLTVSPEDFPLMDCVAAHDENERPITSWLLYKARLRRLSRRR